MNQKAIYQSAVTPKAVKEEQEALKEKKLEEASFASALEFQNYQGWLNHSTTVDFLAELQKQQVQLMNAAMMAAMTNDTPTQTKHLIQLDTIERILAYARNKTPIY